MSFKEVRELRTAGKLDEALQLAISALEKDPENVWNKRAAAWVYYDFLKKNINPDFFVNFKENLIRIKELQLSEDEKMIFDNCAWQIGSFLFAMNKADKVDYSKVNELFELIREFHFTKPSEAFSFLYKAFHKVYPNWIGYLSFADWWDFKNFRAEDYLQEEFNGKRKMSIVEQAYIAYSKKLLDGDFINSADKQRTIDRVKIESFLSKLDSLIHEHSNYQYPPYFKAKLLLKLGEGNDILASFLPFARQKRNDFWVWELMADIFPDDKEKQFACYCKALTLKTPEDFLVKMRQLFAGILIEKELFNEAKTEIEKVILTREKHGWKIPAEVLLWKVADWYKSAKSYEDNQNLYLANARLAEEILFGDIPEVVVVVEFVNEHKKLLNFIMDKKTFGFFNYSGHIKNPKIGDVIKVRFHGLNQDNFYKIFSAKLADSHIKSDALRDFKGVVKIFYPHNFGLVEEVFIEPRIVDSTKLENGQLTKGTAILSFNKKKNEWGWKAIRIEKL